MYYLKLAIGIVFLLAANLGFVYFAFPDSIVGRLLFGLIQEQNQAGLRSSNDPVYRTFECDNALPAFTLDKYANPTDAQLANFCSCLWENMPQEGKELARSSVNGKIKAIDGAKAEVFSLVFGQTIQQCLQKRLPS